MHHQNCTYKAISIGLEVNEADYLQKFGPGHFSLTFMLGEKGTGYKSLLKVIQSRLMQCELIKYYEFTELEFRFLWSGNVTFII